MGAPMKEIQRNQLATPKQQINTPSPEGFIGVWFIGVATPPKLSP
jgi:hypothetical protein